MTRHPQPELPAIAPHCPHCGGRRTHLERPLADDGSIVADRWRCDAPGCGRRYWQLHLPAVTRPMR